MKKRNLRLAAAFVAVGFLVGCSATVPEIPDEVVVDFQDDGCTPVITAVSPEKLNMMTALALEFKNSAQHDALALCATIYPTEVGSGEAGRLLKLSGELWTEEETTKPRPTLWSPASSIWMDQVGAVNGEALVDGWQSFTRTPVVFAMPERMARTLGWPDEQIGIQDMHDLCLNPDGWGQFGGSAGLWGSFKLGKTNPNTSTTGLNTLVMQSYALSGKADGLTEEDVLAAAQFSQEFESCVIHYGDTTGNVLQRVYDRDAEGRPLDYVSAIAVEEISVIAYNQGNPNTRALTPEETAALVPPDEKLVAIYPEEGSLTSDNPIVVLGGPKADWVTPEQATAGEAFIDFLLSDAVQEELDEYGFRPLDPTRTVGGMFTPEFGVDAQQPVTWLEKPSVNVTLAAVQQWETIRKPSSVLILLDVSGSMGDDAGTGNSRLDEAIASAQNTLGHFRSTDELGLWAFTTGVDSPYGPGVVEIREVSPLAGSRESLSNELGNLVPLNGTPMYDAVDAAYAYMSERAEPGRINAIILLSDGEDTDSATSLDKLLVELRDSTEGGQESPVRIFSIVYGQNAPPDQLTAIAEASGGQVFNAADPRRINAVFQSVVNNF